MVSHAIKQALGLAVLFAAVGCGSEGPETSRAKVGSASPENLFSVSLGLEDGPAELSLVSQAFSGYVLSLAGGDDCWGPQGKTYDSATNQPLVVRKGAAGCGVNILKLRFKEATAEILATSGDADGLPALAGRKGSFVAGNQRVFEVKVTTGLTTASDSMVLLAGRELKVDASARHVIKSCTTAWGVEIADGDSIAGFATATVPYGSKCASKLLVCNDGVLSDAAQFKFASCTEPTLQSVTLASDKAEVMIGATAQLTLKARFSDGSVVSVTPQSFTAQPANLVQITAAGVLKGLVDGALSVTARFDGMNSNALPLSVYKFITQTVVVDDNVVVSKLAFVPHWSGGTGLNADTTSANMACVKLGYLSGTIRTSGHYVAPYNETLYFWNGTSWSFKQSKASDREHVETLNCVQQCKVSGASKICSPN